ncbi:MAG: coproporphyrinogen III oxidase family protein [Deltaproteobacteria bacterium]|nr:coproporphyrinogen III oxidase family protein [Deltaproteobacteria bacterium]
MCHYCDFPKTANWDRRLLEDYLSSLRRHLDAWLVLSQERGLTFDTVFVGGGTPGLLTSEFGPLFELLSGFGVRADEISLEANPENITPAHLKSWKALGFNRLSIGVQSFQESGLRLLTRQIEVKAVLEALKDACAVFDNVSIDLIYGWPGQTVEDWQKDLAQALQFPLSHLSLYCLMFEEKTPLGRSFRRGQIDALSEETQVAFYQEACEILDASGFSHYECSNWARPGKECLHNIKYWQNDPYVGIGAGACGYLPDDSVGLRYSYGRNERSFTHLDPMSILPEERVPIDWLREYVGCGLRYQAGLDLNEAKKRGFVFSPRGIVAEALHDGRLSLSGNCLTLSKSEWLRETRWCLETLECFSLGVTS